MKPGYGYIVNEEFEPAIYHASTTIENGLGPRASRKTLVVRIAHESSQAMKQ